MTLADIKCQASIRGWLNRYLSKKPRDFVWIAWPRVKSSQDIRIRYVLYIVNSWFIDWSNDGPYYIQTKKYSNWGVVTEDGLMVPDDSGFPWCFQSRNLVVLLKLTGARCHPLLVPKRGQTLKWIFHFFLNFFWF